MKPLILLSLLSLGACSSLQTPDSRYYALTKGVTETAKVAEGYIDGCTVKPVADPCHAVVPRIAHAAAETRATLKQADKVFVTGDSQYYDLSLSVAENALANLQRIITEEKI